MATNYSKKVYTQSLRDADDARRAEQARETRINMGLRNIAAIFDGGASQKFKSISGKAGYQPDVKYFFEDGERFKINKDGFNDDVPGNEGKNGKPGKPLPVAEQFARALKKGLNIRVADKTYKGSRPLLQARKTAMKDYYYPQLDKNHATAEDELTFALARAGLLGSTAEGKRRTDLTEGYNLERAGIASDISRDLAGTRTQLNSQRTALEGQLRSSADATATTNSALAATKTIAADAPQLNPLENTLLAFADNIGAARNGYDVGKVRQASRGSTVNRDLSRVYG